MPSRRAALAYLSISLVLAVACIAYGFVEPAFFWGGALVLAAAWYGLAIRWVDRRGGWPPVRS